MKKTNTEKRLGKKDEPKDIESGENELSPKKQKEIPKYFLESQWGGKVFNPDNITW